MVARLFLPGEEPHLAHSRVQEVVARVMGLDEAEVDRLVARLVDDFAPRHRDYEALLTSHASVVASHIDDRLVLSPARALLRGGDVHRGVRRRGRGGLQPERGAAP